MDPTLYKNLGNPWPCNIGQGAALTNLCKGDANPWPWNIYGIMQSVVVSAVVPMAWFLSTHARTAPPPPPQPFSPFSSQLLACTCCREAAYSAEHLGWEDVGAVEWEDVGA
jgi:hypothetical protein